MLKALHPDKGILTGKECADCASKGVYWYQVTAIVVATKSPDVVQHTLHVVREQFAIEKPWTLKDLGELLKGRPTVQLSTHGALILKWCLL